MMDESSENQSAPADHTELADINSASLRRLVQVPGVGRALARRIIEARPFKDLQDLERVEGLGKNRWTDIVQYVYVGPKATLGDAEIPAAAYEETKADTGTALDGTETDSPGEPQTDESVAKEPPSDEPVPSPASPAAQSAGKSAPEKPETVEKAVIPYPARQQAYATRRFVLWTVFLGGCVLILLTVLATLGILSSMNNGLHYARPVDLIPLEEGVKQLDGDLSALHTDLAGVRTRLDNLEGLSGRLTALESAQKSIQAQQKELQTQINEAKQTVQLAEKKVEAIQNQVGEVQSIVDLMKAQVEKFRGFLDGLSKLMGGLVVP